jgi:hypothetical protein
MKAYFCESSVEAQNRLTRPWTRREEGGHAAGTTRGAGKVRKRKTGTQFN